MDDELEIYKENDFRLYECNGVLYLNMNIGTTPGIGKTRTSRYLGSAEIIPLRELTDSQKVKRLLHGELYRVMTLKPYDPETDSDAEMLGDSCSKHEAITLLWSNRYNIQG